MSSSALTTRLGDALLAPANRWALGAMTALSVVQRSAQPLSWALWAEAAYLLMVIARSSRVGAAR